MKDRYLEVTFRSGKPLAAYLYLPRNPDDRSARTEPHETGLLLNYAADGRPIGIEITSPARLTLAALNHALAAVQQEPATADDLAPLVFGRKGPPASVSES